MASTRLHIPDIGVTLGIIVPPLMVFTHSLAILSASDMVVPIPPKNTPCICMPVSLSSIILAYATR